MNRGEAVTILILLLIIAFIVGVGGYSAFPASAPSSTAEKFLDAIWFTCQSVSTTGYGLSQWSPQLKIISIMLMIGAGGIWSILISVAATLIPQSRNGQLEA